MIWQVNSATDVLSGRARSRYKIRFTDLMNYTAKEWHNLFRSGRKVKSSELKQRKKLFIVLASPSSYRTVSGVRAKKIVQPLLDLRWQAEGAAVIKGIPVSQGKGIIRGAVKILTSPKQINKMRSGDILVAPMTSPDYIQAMRMAKAIITDVGGLMSHAAIVSRELGIPAIVGTKIATQVLRDGDRVEVDAIKGIVRKID